MFYAIKATGKPYSGQANDSSHLSRIHAALDHSAKVWSRKSGCRYDMTERKVPQTCGNMGKLKSNSVSSHLYERACLFVTRQLQTLYTIAVASRMVSFNATFGQAQAVGRWSPRTEFWRGALMFWPSELLEL